MSEDKRLIGFWEDDFVEDCKYNSWPTCQNQNHPKPYNHLTNPNPPMCCQELCPRWQSLEVPVSDEPKSLEQLGQELRDMGISSGGWKK